MGKIFVPPIKCQGIKTKLVEWIVDNTSFNSKGKWIEPFMGSGVVGFNFRAKNALFSDVNPHIIRFYLSIKRGEIKPLIVRQFLEHEGALLAKHGEDYYYEVRKRFNKNGKPLDFLFLNRSCFNGIIRFNKKGHFNVPFGHKPKRFSKSYITKIANQVDYVAKAITQFNWNFVCEDFRVTISKATSTDLIYCDPPYAGRHVDYFNSWTEQDEAELSRLLISSKAKFILSTWHSNKYRSNELLNTYWAKYNIITREHFYHVGAREKNRNPMLEAIVLNYKPVKTIVYPAQKPIQLQLLEKVAFLSKRIRKASKPKLR
jgi:DNA adenine methylase